LGRGDDLDQRGQHGVRVLQAAGDGGCKPGKRQFPIPAAGEGGLSGGRKQEDRPEWR
jgi:hypothetical protein